MIEVVNRQRRHPVECTKWREFAEAALRKIGRGGESVTVAFVSDLRMKDLNREFRGRNYTTDVLSFPGERFEFEEAEEANNLGDVVISLDRAMQQAAEHELDAETEIAQLILHGLLHLCGHDHVTDDGAMNCLELKLRQRLGI